MVDISTLRLIASAYIIYHHWWSIRFGSLCINPPPIQFHPLYIVSMVQNLRWWNPDLRRVVKEQKYVVKDGRLMGRSKMVDWWRFRKPPKMALSGDCRQLQDGEKMAEDQQMQIWIVCREVLPLTVCYWSSARGFFTIYVIDCRDLVSMSGRCSVQNTLTVIWCVDKKGVIGSAYWHIALMGFHGCCKSRGTVEPRSNGPAFLRNSTCNRY